MHSGPYFHQYYGHFFSNKYRCELSINMEIDSRVKISIYHYIFLLLNGVNQTKLRYNLKKEKLKWLFSLLW